MPTKSRVITFRGEIICDDISGVVIFSFVVFEGLLSDEGLVIISFLTGSCFLVVGFFIQAKVCF